LHLEVIFSLAGRIGTPVHQLKKPFGYHWHFINGFDFLVVLSIAAE